MIEQLSISRIFFIIGLLHSQYLALKQDGFKVSQFYQLSNICQFLTLLYLINEIMYPLNTINLYLFKILMPTNLIAAIVYFNILHQRFKREQPEQFQQHFIGVHTFPTLSIINEIIFNTNENILNREMNLLTLIIFGLIQASLNCSLTLLNDKPIQFMLTWKDQNSLFIPIKLIVLSIILLEFTQQMIKFSGHF